MCSKKIRFSKYNICNRTKLTLNFALVWKSGYQVSPRHCAKILTEQRKSAVEKKFERTSLSQPIFGNVDGSWSVTSKLRGSTLIQVIWRRSKVFQWQLYIFYGNKVFYEVVRLIFVRVSECTTYIKNTCKYLFIELNKI